MHWLFRAIVEINKDLVSGHNVMDTFTVLQGFYFAVVVLLQLFVSPPVGYSTCHWCHVMERESFQDEEIGKILSDNFVCIKLDREERPDVDKVYMTFVQVKTF